MTMDMVRRVGKAPKLRAKGAETRHVVSFGVEVARAMHAHACDQYSAQVLRRVEGLLEFYLTFGVEPYPTEVAQKACLVADACGSISCWLKQKWAPKKRCTRKPVFPCVLTFGWLGIYLGLL